MSRDFYPDSAGSYTSECDKDEVSQSSWSISNSTESDDVEEVNEVKLASCSELSMKVIYHCSVCRVCTDNPHIAGCPYHCFSYLLKQFP